MSFICHIHNYTDYTSSETCSLHLTHPSTHTPGAVGSPGVRCLAQGSHLSRGQFQPETRFEPTTSDYKSNALSTRPRLPHPIVSLLAWELYYSALCGLWIACIYKARHCVYSHGNGLRSLRLQTLTHTSETEYKTTHDRYITDKWWRRCGAWFHSQITQSLCPVFKGLWLC